MLTLLLALSFASLSFVAAGLPAQGSAATTPPAPAPAQDVPASPRIAVVDMQGVLDGYLWAKKQQEEIQKVLEGYNRAIDDLLKKRDELRDLGKKKKIDRDVYDPKRLEFAIKHAELQNIEGQIQAVETEAKIRSDAYKAERSRLVTEIILKVNEDILKAIKAVAEGKKIDLVLRLTEPGEDTVPELRAEAERSRQVLYASKSLDITKDVVTWLNANTKAVAPAPAAASRPANASGSASGNGR